MKTICKTWTHPATGETRVYINDQRIWRGVKVFFTCNEIGGSRIAWPSVQGASGQARKEADQVIDDIGRDCKGDWDALLAMCQN